MDPYLYNEELQKDLAGRNPVHIFELPYLLLDDIFSHLGFIERTINRRVCRTWREGYLDEGPSTLFINRIHLIKRGIDKRHYVFLPLLVRQALSRAKILIVDFEGRSEKEVPLKATEDSFWNLSKHGHIRQAISDQTTIRQVMVLNANQLQIKHSRISFWLEELGYGTAPQSNNMIYSLINCNYVFDMSEGYDVPAFFKSLYPPSFRWLRVRLPRLDYNSDETYSREIPHILDLVAYQKLWPYPIEQIYWLQKCLGIWDDGQRPDIGAKMMQDRIKNGLESYEPAPPYRPIFIHIFVVLASYLERYRQTCTDNAFTPPPYDIPLCKVHYTSPVCHCLADCSPYYAAFQEDDGPELQRLICESLELRHGWGRFRALSLPDRLW
ncbi:hypothetical protein RvY_14122 [Ramazzottius varieornatus]|uniref:F-box domain-containing protein n=1 Tax=Ramazzottius varieornatus TaxID=947166 RepID=A0A1D1VQ79_RAMVA|nr:hypothetical protein RvY_14122 [Ramazzottius varieornatus]